MVAGFQRINSTLALAASRLSSPELIQFDSKALWFYFLCVIGFVATVAANLNGSSIGMYSLAYGNGGPEQILLGSPRAIRSDEWIYATPDILHQTLRSDPFETTTSARGGHSVALLDSVPVRHFSTLFRPQFWAFFVLPLDYAYSFYWQFKGLILLTGVFTWLLFLTRSTFWSICGSLWFFFSAFTQWSYSWSTGLPEMIGLTCIAIVSFCALTVIGNALALSAIVLVTAGAVIDLAMAAYVPHLVPLCWLAVLFVAAWCIANQRSIGRRAKAGRRILAVFMTAVLVGIVGLLVFMDTKEAIVGIAQTGYPGKRTFVGASSGIPLFTASFLQWTETETHFPPALGNICEGSGFLWLAPATLFCMGRLVLSRFQKLAAVSLWVCSLLILAWMLFPIPTQIARVLGLTQTAGARCLPALGLANVGLVALCMSAMRESQFSGGGKRVSLLLGGCRAIGIALLLFVILALTNLTLGSYFSWGAIWFAVGIATALVVLMLENFGRLLGIVLVASQVVAFGATNPVERGLGVITDSDLYNLVRLDRRLLNGKWLVYSDSPVPSGFVEAVGCDTYTGMRFLPDIDHIPLLASRGLNTQIFNNSNYLIAHPILETQKSSFEPVDVAVTRWNVSPSDPILKELGIRYVAFEKKPSPNLVAKLTPVIQGPIDNLWIYRLP
jgi:hypothetical protein